MMLTCIAIDDEYLALQVLREYCKQLPEVSLLREFTNPVDAVAYLELNAVDAILLDIQMPFLNGFDVIGKLKKPPLIIFTTARHDFAIQAYELDVLDYLVKPIPFERFKKAVEKASQFKTLLLGLDNVEQNRNDALFFRADYQVQRVDFVHINYLEGLGEYVKIHTHTKTHITLGPMKELTRQLPKDEFVQIHKSFVIRLSAVTSYTQQQVQIANKVLPVGRVYKKLFQLKFQRYRS